jgi:hypothetical protein
MLTMQIPPEPGAEGFLMDLEFAHLKRSSLDTVEKINVPPIRTPSGGMTAPTVRTHTIFGPGITCGPGVSDVIRAAAMTVMFSFLCVLYPLMIS